MPAIGSSTVRFFDNAGQPGPSFTQHALLVRPGQVALGVVPRLEHFTLTLKEVTLPGPDGVPVTRPCALALPGNYPRALDGLARLLSLDMRVVDPAWIGMKLRKLLNYAVPLGNFMAFVPGLSYGQRRQQTWPSTVAYLARLVIHRYALLGVLDEEGFPLREMGVLASSPRLQRSGAASVLLQASKPCPECGNPSVIHKEGCDFCTACG